MGADGGANMLRFASAYRDACGKLPQVIGSPFGRPDQKVQVRRVPGSRSGPFSIFGSQSGVT